MASIDNGDEICREEMNEDSKKEQASSSFSVTSVEPIRSEDNSIVRLVPFVFTTSIT